MDREWMYKQLDQVARSMVEFNKLIDVQTRLIESLNDRVASMEECARLAPTRAVRRPKTQNKKGTPTPSLSLPGG